MKRFSMKNRVVVITGGNGFLGREYARFLKKAGAKIIIWDYKGSGGETVDITDKSSVENKVNEVIKKWGRIDVLINNAALNPVPDSKFSREQFSPYEKYPLDLWKKELDTGMTGAFISTQAVAAAMKKRRSGVIINIGSHYGLVAPDNRIYSRGMFKSIAYASVKGAIPNFTRSWAAYLSAYGIRVNCLVLGGVFRGHDEKFAKEYGKRTMLGRMAQKNEYNEAILFLASDASSYMTGSTLVVDGGWTAW